MGIEVSLFQITHFQFKKVQKNPQYILDWFFLEEDADYPAKTIDFENLYLGRSHHGLYYIITGERDSDNGDLPGSCAVFGRHYLESSENLGISCK